MLVTGSYISWLIDIDIAGKFPRCEVETLRTGLQIPSGLAAWAILCGFEAETLRTGLQIPSGLVAWQLGQSVCGFEAETLRTGLQIPSSLRLGRLGGLGTPL